MANDNTSSDFYVTILGSGAAIPTLSRHCSAQVVNIHGYRILLDCGEGTQNQLRAYHQRMLSLSLICISHLHGDHFFGLPGLLSTMHMCGRTEPLDIIGPCGIGDAIHTLLNFSGSQLEYPITFHELDVAEFVDAPRSVFDDSRCHVSAFALQHSVNTFGFIVEEEPHGNRPPRRYAYCSDTGYFDQLPTFVSGVNLLCMESTYADDFASIAVEKGHCTASMAATVAQKANVKQLLLTHFSARYKDITPIIEQSTAIFPDTLTAEDGRRYCVCHWEEKKKVSVASE